MSAVDHVHGHIATCEIVAESAASFIERAFDWLPDEMQADALRNIHALQQIANGRSPCVTLTEQEN